MAKKRRSHPGGVTMSPNRARSKMRRQTLLRVGPAAGVYLAAVMDFLVEDVLVEAVKRTHAVKRQATKHCSACGGMHVARLNPRNVAHVLARDEELGYATLTKDVVFPHVGNARILPTRKESQALAAALQAADLW